LPDGKEDTNRGKFASVLPAKTILIQTKIETAQPHQYSCLADDPTHMKMHDVEAL
jgi:hypothetical protein